MPDQVETCRAGHRRQPRDRAGHRRSAGRQRIRSGDQRRPRRSRKSRTCSTRSQARCRRRLLPRRCRRCRPTARRSSTPSRARFGRLDVLVNNAGVAPNVRADILDATEESFDRVIGINLKGPYFLTQLVARWMVEQRKADADVPRRDRERLVGQRDRSLDQPRRLLHQQGRRRDGHAAVGPPAGRVRHRRVRSPARHHPHRHDARR